jgi:hypothetical protein
MDRFFTRISQRLPNRRVSLHKTQSHLRLDYDAFELVEAEVRLAPRHLSHLSTNQVVLGLYEKRSITHKKKIVQMAWIKKRIEMARKQCLSALLRPRGLDEVMRMVYRAQWGSREWVPALSWRARWEEAWSEGRVMKTTRTTFSPHKEALKECCPKTKIML